MQCFLSWFIVVAVEDAVDSEREVFLVDVEFAFFRGDYFEVAVDDDFF